VDVVGHEAGAGSTLAGTQGTGQFKAVAQVRGITLPRSLAAGEPWDRGVGWLGTLIDRSPSGVISATNDAGNLTVFRGDLEYFAVRQVDSFHVKLIAEIASFEEDAEFTLVDPRHPSVMTRDIQKATVSILFFKRVATADVQRTNLMHVANYDERFGVKLRPIRTLRF
jgi:hypothetical protein